MLPNLIIIGATKSGTSSLHNYLNLHPEIVMSQIKELDFFVYEKNWSKGLLWYESNFDPTDQTKILGESSPNYTAGHIYRGVPERIHSVLPEAKLIYILRDPIDRIISHYVHNYRRRVENRKISEVLIDLENNPYVLWSKYYSQLTPYLDYFSPDSILVLTLEDLSRNPQPVLQKVFRFLAVDDTFNSSDFAIVHYAAKDKRRMNQVGVLWSMIPAKKWIKPFLPTHFSGMYRKLTTDTVKKPVLDEKLKLALIHLLREDVELLRKFTGYNFETWCL